nr:uncharacterized protein LOC124496155 isoform X2 [Dermatophagoides farinae]
MDPKSKSKSTLKFSSTKQSSSSNDHLEQADQDYNSNKSTNYKDFIEHRYICSIYACFSVQCSLVFLSIHVAQWLSAEFCREQSIDLAIIFGLATIVFYIILCFRPLNLNIRNDNNNAESKFLWLDATLQIIFTLLLCIWLTVVSFIQIKIFKFDGRNIIIPMLVMVFCWCALLSLVRCWYHYNQFTVVDTFGKPTFKQYGQWFTTSIFYRNVNCLINDVFTRKCSWMSSHTVCISFGILFDSLFIIWNSIIFIVI